MIREEIESNWALLGAQFCCIVEYTSALSEIAETIKADIAMLGQTPTSAGDNECNGDIDGTVIVTHVRVGAVTKMVHLVPWN